MPDQTPTLLEEFGNIDIYLFDQLLKGTYEGCRTVLDAGCGAGRNLVYFLRHGFEVYGIDPDASSVERVRRLASDLAPALPSSNFRVAYAEDLPFADASFDLLISSAVLHFARDPAHFDAMLASMWRVLKPGGYFLARLASDIGIEERVVALGRQRFRLPDGSERFLVDEEFLLSRTQALNAKLHEPIKTTNVQNLRCMTTWCLRKD